MSDGIPVALRSIDAAELGRRIKTARVERRMTQSAMCAGVASVAYVSRIESGQRRPDIEVLEGLARNLGMSPRELLGGDVTPLSTRIRLELDYAELELATGSPAAARDRIAALGTIGEQDLAELARYLDASAAEALGEDPLPLLQSLIADGIASTTLWLRTQIALCRGLREAGDLDGAIRAGAQALDTVHERALPASRETVQLALTVASAHHMATEADKALRTVHDVLPVAEALADRPALISAYWSASTTEALAGNLTDAVVLAERALVHVEADADDLTRARLLGNLGMYQVRADPPQPEEALRNLRASNALMDSTSATIADKERNLVAIAQAHRLLSDHDEALAILDRLAGRASSLNPHVRAEAALTRGQVLHEAGRPGAREAFDEAVLAASSVGVDRSLANFWYEIAGTFEATGDATGAIDAYKRAAIAGGAVPFSQMSRTTTSH